VVESYGPTDNLLANVPLDNYIPGGSLSANTWYDVNIPLADLNAATSIGGKSHSYDNNGNLTADSLWNHTWNYRNNIAQSAKRKATPHR
jgi:hypothetical protein